MKSLEKTVRTLLYLACIISGNVLAQPVLLKSIPVTSTNFTSSQTGRLYFTSNDSLWTSNSTPASTYFIKKTGEPFVNFTNLGLGTFTYFTTLQTNGKIALWRTNGTGSNTT